MDRRDVCRGQGRVRTRVLGIPGEALDHCAACPVERRRDGGMEEDMGIAAVCVCVRVRVRVRVRVSDPE